MAASHPGSALGCAIRVGQGRELCRLWLRLATDSETETGAGALGWT
jgi:hypothetical protein